MQSDGSLARDHKLNETERNGGSRDPTAWRVKRGPLSLLTRAVGKVLVPVRLEKFEQYRDQTNSVHLRLAAIFKLYDNFYYLVSSGVSEFKNRPDFNHISALSAAAVLPCT
jgi:hypothetical protein